MPEQPSDAATNAAPKTIDERFDEVAQGFLDQRDYTTFCFEKLRRDMRQEIRQSEGRLSRCLDRQDLILGEILTEVKARGATPPTAPDLTAPPHGAGA